MLGACIYIINFLVIIIHILYEFKINRRLYFHLKGFFFFDIKNLLRLFLKGIIFRAIFDERTVPWPGALQNNRPPTLPYALQGRLVMQLTVNDK